MRNQPEDLMQVYLDDRIVRKSQPTPADVHVNRPLTNISTAFIQDTSQFVCDRMFPAVPVAKQSDQFRTYDRSFWERAEAEKRGPGTESAGAGYEVGTDDYSCDVWALHTDIADQTRSNQDAPLNLDRDGTLFVTQQLMLRKEIEFLSTFFVTGVWTGENTPSTTWDLVGSDPIQDITDEIVTVAGLTGFKPNKLLMGANVWNKVKNHPDVIDRIKHVGTRTASPQIFADLLEIDEVLVSWAVQNSAKEGQTRSTGFIGGDHALLVHTPSAPGLLTPAAGYTFNWTGFLGAGAAGNRVRRFRMDPIESWRVEGEMAWDQKLVSADLGHFFLSPAG